MTVTGARGQEVCDGCSPSGADGQRGESARPREEPCVQQGWPTFWRPRAAPEEGLEAHTQCDSGGAKGGPRVMSRTLSGSFRTCVGPRSEPSRAAWGPVSMERSKWVWNKFGNCAFIRDRSVTAFKKTRLILIAGKIQAVQRDSAIQAPGAAQAGGTLPRSNSTNATTVPSSGDRSTVSSRGWKRVPAGCPCNGRNSPRTSENKEIIKKQARMWWEDTLQSRNAGLGRARILEARQRKGCRALLCFLPSILPLFDFL